MNTVFVVFVMRKWANLVMVWYIVPSWLSDRLPLIADDTCTSGVLRKNRHRSQQIRYNVWVLAIYELQHALKISDLKIDLLKLHAPVKWWRGSSGSSPAVKRSGVAGCLRFVPWVHQGMAIFDQQVYTKLIKDWDQFLLRHSIYYQYRKQESPTIGGISTSYLVDGFTWLSCGHGVRSWCAAVWTVAISFMWAFFYWVREWYQTVLKRVRNVLNKTHPSVMVSMLVWPRSPQSAMGLVSKKLLSNTCCNRRLLFWLILALFLATLANVMVLHRNNSYFQQGIGIR